MKCFAAGLISGFLAGERVVSPALHCCVCYSSELANRPISSICHTISVGDRHFQSSASRTAGNHINTEIGLEIYTTSSTSRLIGVILGERISQEIEAEKSKKLVALALLSIT